MSGVGGDGFWIIQLPGREPVGLNASGPAAAAATPAFYCAQGYENAPPLRGPLAALTVPGAVDGWHQAYERFGRLAWRRLFDAAEACAEEGVAVAASLARWLTAREALLRTDPGCAAVFLADGRLPAEGERLRQPALASTLRAIASRGAREGYYEGTVGAVTAARLEQAGSPLRGEDFRRYHAQWVQPLRRRSRDVTFHQLPPNSQGFTFLEMLGIWEHAGGREHAPESAGWFHLMVEAAKLAAADRDHHLADPDQVEVPIDELLLEDYLAARASVIHQQRALPAAEVRSGLVGGNATRAKGDTCYFCVVDGDGMAVSAIQSLYFDFGAAFLVPDTGILFQNRGSSFRLRPPAANLLAPGRRPFHTLMPGLATRDGTPVLLFGTMGGEGQPQTSMTLALRILDAAMEPQAAIDAPRWLWGRTWGPGDPNVLWLEAGIGRDVAADLHRWGHQVRAVSQHDERFGHAQAIVLEDGTLRGGADPRGDGEAIHA